ncbi:hypothetical protein LINPERHAP1_LOCUS10693, partial [Linum perenne]
LSLQPPLPFSLSLSPPSSSLNPNLSSLNKRRRRRAFEPLPADHLSTSHSIVPFSLSRSAKGERGNARPLDQRTVVAAAPRATPSPLALPPPPPPPPFFAVKSPTTRGTTCNPKDEIRRRGQQNENVSRRPPAIRFLSLRTTNPKGKGRKRSGEETAGAATSPTTTVATGRKKKVTFLEG